MGDFGNINVQNVLIGGGSAITMLIFLIQTVRETFNIESRYIPVVAIVLALTLALLGYYLPSDLVTVIATGILLAAAGSMSVRYVKNGKQDTNADSRNTTDSIQGYNLGTPRLRSAEGIGTTSTVYDERPTDFQTLGGQFSDCHTY